MGGFDFPRGFGGPGLDDGENNTASNAGSGTSLFYQKSGVDLQFNGIKSENPLLTVSLDAVSHDIELTVNEGTFDHGNLAGLGDDDHTQYLLADGTRDLTGDWTITSNDILFNDNQGIKFGTGQDGYIYYDGSNLKIKSDEVGTGRIHLLSNVFTDRWSNQGSNTFLGVNAAGSGNLSGGFNTLYGNGAGNELTTGFSNTCLGYVAGRDLTTGYENTIIGSLAGRNTTGIRDVIIGAQAGQNKTTGNANTIIGHRAGKRNAGLGAISSTVLIGKDAGFTNAPSQCIFLGYQAGYHESNTHRLYIANSSTVNPLIYGEFDNKLIRINAETDLISSVHPILYLRHKAEITSGVGFGVSLNYELDDSGGNAELAGVAECVWADNTNGSEVGQLKFKTLDEAGDGLTDRFIVDKDNFDFQVDIKTDRWLDSDTNVFIGKDVVGAGTLSHTSGNQGWRNIGIGNEVFYDITTGYGNVAMGYRALFNVTSGFDNFALGEECLLTLTTGTANTAIGKQALYYALGARGNFAFGYRCLYRTTSGRYNTGMGYRALYENTSAYYNIGIGFDANRYNQTGYGNVCLGDYSGRGTANHSKEYNIRIGYSAGRYDTNDKRLIIDCHDQTNAANEVTNCIVYGVMDATPSNQTLNLNARVLARYGIETIVATDNVSDPPTDAELDTAFGDPSTLNPGFIGVLDDNDAGTDVYVCYTTGVAGEWFYIKGTKAV